MTTSVHYGGFKGKQAGCVGAMIQDAAKSSGYPALLSKQSKWGATGVGGEGRCDLDAKLISLCVPGNLGESPPSFPGLHILKGVRHSRESITVVHMGPRA